MGAALSEAPSGCWGLHVTGRHASHVHALWSLSAPVFHFLSHCALPHRRPDSAGHVIAAARSLPVLTCDAPPLSTPFLPPNHLYSRPPAPPLIIKSLPDIKANLLMLSAAPPSKPKDGYDEVGSLEQCLVNDEERRGAMLTVGVCLPSAGTWGPDSRRVCRPGCGQQCGRWVEQQRRGTKHGSSPGIVKAPKPHACFGSVRRPIGAFKPLTGFVSELFGSKFNYTFNHTDIRELITL